MRSSSSNTVTYNFDRFFGSLRASVVDWPSDHSVGDSKWDYFQKKSDAVWVVKYSSVVSATKLIELSICFDCNSPANSPCLWQVPAAFPVESQFTFTNQSEGEPFPLENRSSMGELQVKQLFVVSGWMVCILCNFHILNPVPIYYSCQYLLHGEFQYALSFPVFCLFY